MEIKPEEFLTKILKIERDDSWYVEVVIEIMEGKHQGRRIRLTL